VEKDTPKANGMLHGTRFSDIEHARSADESLRFVMRM